MMHRKLTKQQLTDRSLSMKQAYRLTDNELQKAQIATASFLSGNGWRANCDNNAESVEWRNRS